MKDKHIRNLILIWVVSFILAWVTAYAFVQMSDGMGGSGPTEGDPTTSWHSAPSTTLADMVRKNVGFTIGIIFPFLYAPLFMLIYCIANFTKDKNPKAATFHEHVTLELFWTIVPAFVLVAMAVPAYKVLLFLEREPKNPDVMVDVTGVQFYWQYYFPDYDVTISDDGTGTDPVYFPVDKNIALRGQSPQVNHAWWVPSFGIKFDVIPGHISSGWIRPTQEGYFKGQCAELCGTLHAYMWIHVKVVSEKEFYLWLQEKGATWPIDQEKHIREILGTDFKEKPVEAVTEAPGEAALETPATPETETVPATKPE